MFFSMLIGVYLSTPLFMTGSIIGLMVYDFSLPYIDINLNFMTWFMYTLPGLFLSLTLFYIALFIFF